MRRATEAGARRAVQLKVAGGFHSPLTAIAADRLRPALEAVALRRAAHAVPLDRTTCRLERAQPTSRRS